ncbi:HTH-type transcriptional regulator KipR [bacterium BMS3Bbin02]|nr:HTH-type transcriptional regulator KipR [bacterium BMS3Bbin02]
MAESSKTVNLALAVLRRVPDAPTPTATALALDLGTSRQAVLRCLRSLEQFDMVHQDGSGWVLGRGVLELAHRATGDLVNALRPTLVDLAATWNETALVALPVGDQAVAADQVMALGRMVRIDYAVGSAYDLTVGAHGRAILAFHPVRDTLAATDPVRAEIRSIRKQGYAVSHDEIESGVTGVAAPILDADSNAIASIGIVAPTHRVSRIAELANAIMATASQATRQLATSQLANPPHLDRLRR